MKCSHHVKNTSTIILIMIPSDQNISQLKPSIEIILIDKLNAKVRQELLLIIGERDRPSPLLLLENSPDAVTLNAA